ncbi:MAG: type II secretion system protein GspG [Candidatus Omnitrophica bacterium]|nr:type II secretion system protein GspG [Candidatus Omnitrophota bacterium]
MRKGFTLIELIVVIAIIAILAAIIAPNAFKAIEKARNAKTIADLKAIKTAITALYADTGRFTRGCAAFVTTELEMRLNDEGVGLLDKPVARVWHAGGSGDAPCEWTASNVEAWDGPYVEGGNLIDVWQEAYIYDGDYTVCTINCAGGCVFNIYTECASADPARLLCEDECGPAGPCKPPVLGSFGPDGEWYTCDDIVVKLSN